MSEKYRPFYLCPGPDGWVAWQQADDGTWSPGDPAPAEAKSWELAPGRGPWQLGLPLRSLQTLALKIPTGEHAATLDEVIPLRLEAAGLDAGSDKVVLADWAVAHGKSDSQVVTVWTVDGNVLDGCPANRIPDSAAPAFMRWKWQPKELVIWCEWGRWIAAFSGDACPVHVQPCTGVENISQLAADLRGQATALLLRGLSALPERVVVRGACPDFVRELAGELGMPLVEKPDAPDQAMAANRLVVKEMVAAREARVEAKKWRVRIAAVAVVWLGLAGYAAYGFAGAGKELDAARQRHELVTPRATEMREVQKRIDQIVAANGVDALPLEVLSRLSKTMPASDFRLTTFTVEGDRDVFLRGSARRADLALRFAQDLRRNKELTAYQWETPPPGQEKDGTAAFTYTGRFRANLTAQP